MSFKEYHISYWFRDLLIQFGFNADWVNNGIFVIGILLTLFIFFTINKIAKITVLKFIYSVIKKTKFTWDDELAKTGILENLVYLVPVIITKAFFELFFENHPVFSDIFEKIIAIGILLITVNLIRLVLDFVTEITRKNSYNAVAIQGVVQMIKIVIFILSLILFFSILSNVDISKIFAGLGAITAVLILIFKDTIMGFMSSIQIAFSKTVKVGDWITLPKYSVDGDIEEINLFSTKIRNWDKTISSIPTSSLLNSDVKNWKGMTESKVRRIKKHINIDANSIQFCDMNTINKFKYYQILKPFIETKELEIKNHNKNINANKNFAINGRNLTNIGLFRNYAELYLQNHNLINKNEIIMVRLLQPTTEGIPLEIYCFCKDTEWVNFEKIQSDILDHLLSSVKDFDLEIFQLKIIRR